MNYTESQVDNLLSLKVESADRRENRFHPRRTHYPGLAGQANVGSQTEVPAQGNQFVSLHLGKVFFPIQHANPAGGAESPTAAKMHVFDPSLHRCGKYRTSFLNLDILIVNSYPHGFRHGPLLDSCSFALSVK